jgi:hypothetical protein
VEPNSAWTRNIPLGGNNFTEALVRAFKLSFAKAESLKRTAASSKYARQIFQAMRPVFAELVAEIQRSIGFFSSTHRDVELRSALALGNAFRLPGLQKYLENNLTISGGVIKLERFNQMIPTATVNAPQFSENVLTFAPAYGLALQGLGLAKINASMLPTELARLAIWNRKRPLFIAAAACLGVAALLPWGRAMLDRQALASADNVIQKANEAIQQANKYKSEYQKVQSNTKGQEDAIKDLLAMRDNVAVVPQILTLPFMALPEPQPALKAINSMADMKKLWESGAAPSRKERGQFLIDTVDLALVDEVDKVNLGAAGVREGLSAGVARTGKAIDRRNAGFVVAVSGRLLYGDTRAQVSDFLENEYFSRLRKLASEAGRGFYIPDDQGAIATPRFRRAAPSQLSGSGAAGGADASQKDPVTGEDVSTDWRVEFEFKLKLGEKPVPGEEKTEPAKKSGKKKP